jgi:hypothetical protein
MSMVLHIQLHILGRCAFEKTLAKQKEAAAVQGSENESDAHGVRHQFLTISVDYLLNDGLEKMIAHVRQAIISSTAG